MFIFMTGCGNSVYKANEITMVEEENAESNLDSNSFTVVEEESTESDLDSIPFTVLADLSSLEFSQGETITILIATEVIDWDYYVETENGIISNKLSTSFDYTRSSKDTWEDTIIIYFTDKGTGKRYKDTIPLVFKNVTNESANFF